METPASIAEAVETVATGEHRDVTSDPALADAEGTDWSDEGGATPSGPATDSDTDTDDAS